MARARENLNKSKFKKKSNISRVKNFKKKEKRPTFQKSQKFLTFQNNFFLPNLGGGVWQNMETTFHIYLFLKFINLSVKNDTSSDFRFCYGIFSTKL